MDALYTWTKESRIFDFMLVTFTLDITMDASCFVKSQVTEPNIGLMECYHQLIYQPVLDLQDERWISPTNYILTVIGPECLARHATVLKYLLNQWVDSCNVYMYMVTLVLLVSLMYDGCVEYIYDYYVVLF